MKQTILAGWAALALGLVASRGAVARNLVIIDVADRRGRKKAVLIAVGRLVGAAIAGGPVAASADEIHVKTAAYEFSYSYPAAAARIPALKARLDKAAARQQAEIAAQAREGRATAKRNSFPFNAYDSSTEWRVVADLPAWLSLSATRGDYTGGAHPNHGPAALLWDKTRNREVKAADLFASKAALSAAIRARFCAALNRQRAEKRGAPVDPRSKDQFDACLDPADQVVILGSADHARFTRIGVLMGPYAAGPYVEGDYEVTLPVTQAVLSAVRPEYRDAFALGPAASTVKPARR